MNSGQILRFVLVAGVALGLTVGIPVFADGNLPVENPPAVVVTRPAPVTTAELIRFEEFLELYPIIAARLRDNPQVVYNLAFQKNHPLFAQFLRRYPEVKAVLAARPRWFIHRELVRQAAGSVTLVQVAEFDQFLDQHPQLEKDLLARPQQLRRAEFLKAHPELNVFWQRHPGLERASEAKPTWPTRRGRRN